MLNFAQNGIAAQSDTPATTDKSIATDAPQISDLRRRAALALPAITSAPAKQDSDPTQGTALPVTVLQTAEPARPILPLTATLTLRRNGSATENLTAAPLDDASAPEAEAPTAPLPPPPQMENASADSVQNAMAFAARLSPDAGIPQLPADAIRSVDQPSPVQTLAAATQLSAKQVAIAVEVATDGQSNEGGDQPAKEKGSQLLAKPDALLPPTSTPGTVHSATPVSSGASPAPASPLSAMAQMDKVLTPPPAAASSHHDITVRIPDASEQGTAVRFVERGGEVHVSVRTGDTEMAQTLRGGINDLVKGLEEGGIRTEVWQPGGDTSSPHGGPHNPFTNPDGSQNRQSSSGSNSEQESNQQNKPRWVEELEGSIGNSNFKEITQIPWQA
jgi:hypothetical protein